MLKNHYLSLFSGNLVVTSSWKMRTLSEGHLFSSKGRSIRNKAGEEIKKLASSFKHRVPPLVLRSHKWRKGEKMGKRDKAEAKYTDQNSDVAQSSAWFLLLLERLSFGLIMTCFKQQCQHIVSTQDNTTTQTVQPDIRIPDWPLPLCRTQYFKWTQSVLIFFQGWVLLHIWTLKKKLTKNCPKSFSELCYF